LFCLDYKIEKDWKGLYNGEIEGDEYLGIKKGKKKELGELELSRNAQKIRDIEIGIF